MSAARGGRKSSRPVSRMTDMLPLRRAAREKQKGRWRPISLAKLWRPPSVAAYAFSRLFCCFGHRPHRHISAALEALLELDLAADLGEQSVDLAHRNICARMHLRAELANDVDDCCVDLT